MNDRVTKTVTMDRDLAERLEKEAKKENRSLSNYVETRLIERFSTDNRRRQSANPDPRRSEGVGA